MAQDNHPQNNVQPNQPKGLIGTLFSSIFHVCGLLLGSLFLSIVLEYLGLAFFWGDQGWHHSQAMFNTELEWLSGNFTQSLIIQEPGKTVAWLLDQVYQWLFAKTGFMEFAKNAQTVAQSKGALGFASRIYLLIEDYALAALYVVLVFMVRLMVLVLSIPLFILAGIVGGTDGLMRRDLRRFGAGRESSFVYHRAKRLIVPLLLAPWVIYLTIPISLHPVLILIPCAVALGLAILITTATFKKYL